MAPQRFLQENPSVQKVLIKHCHHSSSLYHSLIFDFCRSGTNETLKMNSHVISMSLFVPVKENAERNILVVMKHFKVSYDIASKRVISPSENSVFSLSPGVKFCFS